MARESNQNEQLGRKNDPAQSDLDPNEIADGGGPGSDASMYNDLSEAQTAGSRNDRVTEYEGVERKVEPTTESEYSTGVPPKGAPVDAPGITNRTLGEERPGQEKVMVGRADASVAEDPDGVPKDADKPIEGGLPGRKEEKVKTVVISTL